MMLRFTALLLSLMFVTPMQAQDSSPENAAPSKDGGPPEREQILGIWQLVEAIELEEREDDAWSQPFQWFGLYDDGSMCSMMTTEEMETTVDELDATFQVLDITRRPKFVYEKPFLTVTYPDIPGHKELWGLNIAARDIEGTKIKEGDLLMSLDSGEGAVIYLRILRKIE